MCPYTFLLEFVHYAILILWLLSLVGMWRIRKELSGNLETQGRIFIAYVLITFMIVLHIAIRPLLPEDVSKEYVPHLTIELIGLSLTVLLVDRVYKYIQSKNEELYRRLSLRMCKMPIYTYCMNWFFIFEPNPNARKSLLSKYDNLKDFFNSDDLYYRIIAFDFNQKIDPVKTYAEYCANDMKKINDRFQNILVKYAAKLSFKDIQFLEHFGGKAFMFTVFEVMRFISSAKFTQTTNNQAPVTVYPFNNSFKDISKENFVKHFNKLVEFIDEYNSSVDNDYEKWTIKNIGELSTVEKANKNPLTDW